MRGRGEEHADPHHITPRRLADTTRQELRCCAWAQVEKQNTCIHLSTSDRTHRTRPDEKATRERNSSPCVDAHGLLHLSRDGPSLHSDLQPRGGYLRRLLGLSILARRPRQTAALLQRTLPVDAHARVDKNQRKPLGRQAQNATQRGWRALLGGLRVEHQGEQVTQKKKRGCKMTCAYQWIYINMPHTFQKTCDKVVTSFRCGQGRSAFLNVLTFVLSLTEKVTRKGTFTYMIFRGHGGAVHMIN